MMIFQKIKHCPKVLTFTKWLWWIVKMVSDRLFCSQSSVKYKEYLIDAAQPPNEQFGNVQYHFRNQRTPFTRDSGRIPYNIAKIEYLQLVTRGEWIEFYEKNMSTWVPWVASQILLSQVDTFSFQTPKNNSNRKW